MINPFGASSTTRTAGDAGDSERYFKIDHIKADLKSRTVRGGAVVMAAEGAKQCLLIAATVVLARLLTPRDTGLVTMVIVITGFIELFSDLGLSAATIQREQIDQRQVSALFWINVAVGVGLAALTAALAPAIAWFYAEPRLVWITVAIGSGFIFSSLTVQHRALLKRQMRFSSLALIDVAVVLGNVVVGVVAALAGFGYWSLVLMKLAAAPFEVLAIWRVCRWRPGRPRGAAGVRSMLSFGGHLTGYRVVTYLMRNVDNLLIGRVYGPQPLGLYAKAYGLLLVPLQRVWFPISTVAMPALSRLADSPERYRRAYARIVAAVCLLTMPLVAFLIGTSDWLILALLGPQWTEASAIFAWLGVSGLIEPFSTMTVWLLLTQGRTRQQFHWGMINAALTIAAIIAGLPWGPVGVAASYGLVGLIVRTPLLFWFVGRDGPVRTRDFYTTLAPFAGASCAILLAIFAFRHWIDVSTPWIGLAGAAALTVVVTGLILLLLPAGRAVVRDLHSVGSSFVNKQGTTPAQ